MHFIRSVRTACAVLVGVLPAALLLGCGGDGQWLATMSQAVIPAGCAVAWPSIENSGYIDHYECSFPGSADKADVIRISLSRPNSEFWVLEEMYNRPPRLAIPGIAHDVALAGSPVTSPDVWNRSRAVIQTNGFNYTQDFIGPSYPVTRVFESGHQFSGLSSDVKDRYGPDYMLSFGPNTPGSPISIDISDPGAAPGNSYNALGSVYPGLVSTDPYCLGLGTETSDWPAIAYNESDAFIIYHPSYKREQLCAFMKNTLGALRGVRMDGGRSSSVYAPTTSGGPWYRGRPVVLDVAYHVGLVTLDENNRIINGNFEAPNLDEENGGAPTGRHPYQATDLGWTAGAVHLYQPSRYKEKTYDGRNLVLPQGTGQMAGIRPLATGVNDFLAQDVEVPANRYCVLTFSHGYHMGPGCKGEMASNLGVNVLNAVELPNLRYQSSKTGTQLHTERLRFLTPDNWWGSTVNVTVMFQNLNFNPECEVLLDDVIVRCAR